MSRLKPLASHRSTRSQTKRATARQVAGSKQVTVGGDEHDVTVYNGIGCYTARWHCSVCGKTGLTDNPDTSIPLAIHRAIMHLSAHYHSHPSPTHRALT